MTDIPKHPSHPDVPRPSDSELVDLAYELMSAIEECGASPELTNAVIKAEHLYVYLKKPKDATPQAIKALLEKPMNFSEALIMVKLGMRIARTGWNGKHMWVAAQYPDTHSRMTEPYLFMRNAQGGLIPWLISQGDVFAEDWVVIKD